MEVLSLDVSNTSRREGRYKVPVVDIDRSGTVKAQTLSYFSTYEGWYSAKELLKHPRLGRYLSKVPDDRAIQMRLLRYSKLGILERRKVSREYQYRITTAGEKRMLYLWEKLGYLDPSRANTDLQKKLMRLRLEIATSIRSKHVKDEEGRLRELSAQ